MEAYMDILLKERLVSYYEKHILEDENKKNIENFIKYRTFGEQTADILLVLTEKER
jgi:hypothetical protein